MNYAPLIIIGAPRSGTNMLRDVLTKASGVATWPCDEINYIWRHGNLRYPSDEFTADLARSSVQNYIRRQFDWVARRYDARIVLEKTCANSLRVPFVDRVIPEARYIFIHRDGLDAVDSALARWKAPLDISYIARKARFVPAMDLPWYAVRYFGSRLYRLVSREGRVGLWGPRFDGMERSLAEYPLDEVCAWQWARCVVSAADAFGAMPGEKWLSVAYEEFVREPEREFGRMLDFAGIEAPPGRVRAAVADVRADSVGRGRARLTRETVARLEGLVGDTLRRFGYA